ncbi:hypothetical protein [Fulvivirga ligni]|uniref:hypothetical protein n=1 Tax=Fulvivirga ligni TaxID=2904246 RepID=UPI001F1D0761|nr:hypothetical protein [Fulvivirga ligni]UII21211.1 hypothetical protein LVD16_25595 [Fulvivirga ligni]
MSIFLIILNLLLMGGVCWWLYNRSVELGDKVFLSALAFKTLATLALGWLYQSYYSAGDILNYFRLGDELNNELWLDPVRYFRVIIGVDHFEAFDGQPGVVFMAKLVSVVNIITGDHFWLSSLWLSLFCFSGLIFLVKVLLQLYPYHKFGILILLFWPSFTFWSSGLLKESLAIGALGFLMGGFILFIYGGLGRNRWKAAIPAALLFLLLWQVKYYYAGVLLLVIVSFLATRMLSQKLKITGGAKQVALYFAFMMLLALIITRLHPNFYLERFAEVIVNNYETYHHISDPEDVVDYDDLEPSFISLAVHSPKALFNGLFRTMIGESMELLKVIAGLENFLFLFLVVAALFRINGIKRKQVLLLCAMLSYVVVLLIFLSLSAPNLGTLSRYRAGVFIVLLPLIAIQNPLIERVKRLVK